MKIKLLINESNGFETFTCVPELLENLVNVGEAALIHMEKATRVKEKIMEKRISRRSVRSP